MSPALYVLYDEEKPSADQMIATGKANEIRMKTEGHRSPCTAHARGIASLVNRAIHDAADRALKLDPNLNEARFNRALATYREMPAESIKEWNEYLKHDPYGPWALEARQMRKDARESQ